MSDESEAHVGLADTAQPAEDRDRALIGYVALVVAAALGATIFVVTRHPAPAPLTVLLWSVLFLIADAMVCRTPGGKGTVSMASGLHLAAIPLLAQNEIVLAAWISRLIVNLTIQRKSWFRSIFNGAQISLAILLASSAYLSTGLPVPSTLGGEHLLALALSFGIGAGIYYVINTGFVCGFLAILNRETIWSVWRSNFGYRSGLVNSLALLLLAPVVVLAHNSIGIIGLAVFFIPMALIRMNWRENVKLEQTQRGLVDSARFAAHGEVAVNVGKEISNYASCMAANLKVLVEYGDRMTVEDQRVRLEALASQIGTMSVLGHGLMDSSELESRFQRVDVFALVKDTVDFVRWQIHFANIGLETNFDPRGGTIEADPQQLQRILVELLLNAAVVPQGSDPKKRRVQVNLRWAQYQEDLLLTVEDNGPGLPEEIAARVFDQGFTTTEEGNWAGLATASQLVQNHGGTIRASSSLTGGSAFKIHLPSRIEKAPTGTEVPSSESPPQAA